MCIRLGGCLFRYGILLRLVFVGTLLILIGCFGIWRGGLLLFCLARRRLVFGSGSIGRGGRCRGAWGFCRSLLFGRGRRSRFLGIGSLSCGGSFFYGDPGYFASRNSGSAKFRDGTLGGGAKFGKNGDSPRARFARLGQSHIFSTTFPPHLGWDCLVLGLMITDGGCCWVKVYAVGKCRFGTGFGGFCLLLTDKKGVWGIC